MTSNQFVRTLLLSSFFSLTLASCGGGDDGDDGENFNPGDNPDNLATGNVSDRAISYFRKGTGYYYLNSPMLSGEHIYIGTSRSKASTPAKDNAIFKLTKDLTEVWSHSLETSEVLGSIAIDGMDNLYAMVLKERKEVFLVSLDNAGNLRWEVQLFAPSNPDTAFHMTSPAITTDNQVIVNGLDSLFSYSSNGELLWSYNPSGLFGGSPILDDADNIYISGVDGTSGFATQYALDSKGEELWSFTSETNNLLITASSSAFSYDYSKVYSIFTDSIYVIDAAAGTLDWKYTIEEGQETLIYASPAVDDKGNIYVGSKSNERSTLYALKGDGSGLLWSKTIGADLYSSPALGNNGVLYLGSENTEGGASSSYRVHAIDMDSGEYVWRSATPVSGSITWSSPLIDDNGVLFIANMVDHNEADDITKGGTVMSFQTDSTGLLSNAGTARYRLNNNGSGKRE
jgi:outer membrane protein assembly factor BamB